MSVIFRYVNSSVGSKKLMGITGLGLCGFLFVHMLGNLLILVSPEAFNEYGNKLNSNPFLIVAELGLIALFLIHIFKATLLTLRNKKARSHSYAMKSHDEKKTSIASRTLYVQGIIVLVFVILHLATFKYGAHYTATYNGVEMRDLYKLVLEVFQQPGYVVWYVIALLVLSLHLGHGFYSSFQSLGLNHPKYSGGIKVIGFLYDLVVSVGFIILPVYVYFLHNQYSR